jgi:hypothetical protein
MEVKKIRAHANNLFGMIKNARTFHQKTTKKLSLKAPKIEFANLTLYERPEVHKSHMVEVELIRAQALAEAQRLSLR